MLHSGISGTGRTSEFDLTDNLIYRGFLHGYLPPEIYEKMGFARLPERHCASTGKGLLI